MVEGQPICKWTTFEQRDKIPTLIASNATRGGVGHHLGLQQEETREIESDRRWIGDALHDDAGAGGVQGIENIVERRGERMNVFAVEGRDGRVELGEHGVSHFVAGALDTAQLRNLRVDVLVAGEKIDHDTGTSDQILRHLGRTYRKKSYPSG